MTVSGVASRAEPRSEAVRYPSMLDHCDVRAAAIIRSRSRPNVLCGQEPARRCAGERSPRDRAITVHEPNPVDP